MDGKGNLRRVSACGQGNQRVRRQRDGFGRGAPEPQDVIVNQAPPLAVFATASKATAAPVLATVKVWGSGFDPFNGLVKAIGFTCSNTESPTTTLTGMVMLLLAARNVTWPV